MDRNRDVGCDEAAGPQVLDAASVTAMGPGSLGQIADGAFEAQAAAALGGVREAIVDLIGSLAMPVRRAVDLAKGLGIDGPLAWRAFRIANVDDALLAAKHMPTPGQFARLIRAAREAGVPSEAVRRLEGATRAYDEFVSEYAGNRRTLGSLIAALQPANTNQIDERVRKTAFEANGHLWGLAVNAEVRTMIVHPEGIAVIVGAVGLHAMRPGVPLVLRATSHTKQDASDNARPVPLSVDRSDVLRRFCSPGLELRRETRPNGEVQTHVNALGIGRKGAVTFFTLYVTRVKTAPNIDRYFALGHLVAAPAASLQMDLMVPAGLGDPRTARMSVFGCPWDVRKAVESQPADLVPVHVPVSRTADVTEGQSSLDVPGYRDVIGVVLDTLGWRGAVFDQYRLRLAYPMLHTRHVLRVEEHGAPLDAPPSV